MKYLKKFNQASEYEAFKAGDEYITPNVSFIEDGNEVMFNSNIINYIFDCSTVEGRKELYDFLVEHVGTNYDPDWYKDMDSGNMGEHCVKIPHITMTGVYKSDWNLEGDTVEYDHAAYIEPMGWMDSIYAVMVPWSINHDFHHLGVRGPEFDYTLADLGSE